MPINSNFWADLSPGAMKGSISRVVSKGMWFWIFSPRINLFKWMIRMVGMYLQESVFIARWDSWQSPHQNAFSPSSVSGWKKFSNLSGRGELESVLMCREMSCILSVVVVSLLHWEHWTVEDICPWKICARGTLTSLIRAISSSWASAESPGIYSSFFFEFKSVC